MVMQDLTEKLAPQGRKVLKVNFFLVYFQNLVPLERRETLAMQGSQPPRVLRVLPASPDLME